MIKNIITGVIAIIVAVVASLALVGNNQPKQNTTQDTTYGATGTRFIHGISADSTSPSDGQVRGTTLTVTGASTLTGTSTVTQSVDGLVVGGTFSTAATGTVRTLYTNSTGPKFCDSHTAFLYVKNNGSFAPSLVFSLGTSTSAVASTNLVASTTVATTTTTIIIPIASSFILAAGDVLTAIIGDITNVEASSTYFSNWSAEAGVWCQDISI